MSNRKRLPKLFQIRATGCSHAPAGALAELREGQRLALVAQPDNPVDPNAIAVMNDELTVQFGWVPAKGKLNVRLLEEIYDFSVTVAEVNTFDGAPKGLMMQFERQAA